MKLLNTILLIAIILMLAWLIIDREDDRYVDEARRIIYEREY